MLQLNPSETFPIVRVLKDHTDTGTYYVRAVIRNASTDALIDTKNLTDHGNRRFSVNYKVPYDNTYQRGRFLLITTTVYTDSGYTTKSDNYAEESETYLVQERFNNHAQFGGAGADIDYEKLRKIIHEELEKMPVNKLEPLVLPEPLDPVALCREITGIVNAKIEAIPAPLPADFAPLLKRLDALSKEIDALPKFEPADNSALVREMQQLKQEILDQYGKHKQTFELVVEPVLSDGMSMKEVSKQGARQDYLTKLQNRYAQ